MVVVNVNRSGPRTGDGASSPADRTQAASRPRSNSTRALISPAGVLAWLQTGPSRPPSVPQQSTQLLFACVAHPVLRSVECHAELLAQGEISADSLRLSARTLGWSIGGIPHTATIE